MKSTNTSWAAKVASACVLMFASTMASAAVFTINIDNETIDGQGSPNNQVLTIDLATALGGAAGAEVAIDAIGWDVTIETVGASWLSEATIGFGDINGNQVNLTPSQDQFAGSGGFGSGGLIDLVGLDLVITLSDGVLFLEFFEGFDDVAGATDAFISGTLDISANLTAAPVPVPAAVWLMGSALLGLMGMRRRA